MHDQATHPETPLSWTTVLNPARFFSLKRKSPVTPPQVEKIMGDDIAEDLSSGKKDEERTENEQRPEHLDPKEYLYARRKLKKAVLEHYRQAFTFP